MKIFFIGIAGAGMASLARYALESGHQICGSDPFASGEARAYWIERGCKVYTSHCAENVSDADLVVYSSAIPLNNVERVEAEKRGIAISRGEALARFANDHGGSIAVCGTHGKGTTAGAIAHILSVAGVPAGDILGAVPKGRLSSSRFVADAKYLVCEVDESDKTHLFHRPKVLLLNNVEVDHLNTYRDLDDIVDCFAEHIRACADSKVIVHYAGVGAPKLYDKLRDCRNVIWVANEACFHSVAWKYRVLSVDENARHSVELWSGSTRIVLECGLPGYANAQNLVSAAVLALSEGIAPAAIREAVTSYAGLRDRCELTKCGNVSLVTDYASHPTCVANDIALNRNQAKRIVAIYHPYRYTLMAHHWTALAEKLSAADVVLLAPFDGAGETPIAGLCSEDLAKRIRDENPNCEAYAYKSFDEVEIAAKQMLKAGDRLIIFGGGSLFNMGHRIVSSL